MRRNLEAILSGSGCCKRFVQVVTRRRRVNLEENFSFEGHSYPQVPVLRKHGDLITNPISAPDALPLGQRFENRTPNVELCGGPAR